MNTIIPSKMENIKTIFQSAQESASKFENISELITVLEATEKEFRPVAYEGAAMTLALKDFSNGDSIINWKRLLDSSKKYACQIYIGMGWAVGQEKRTSLNFIEELDKNMQFRIWDGCGYFDGIFRQRQTIKGQNRLEYISEKNYNAYDEGLGRSIWYICKGDETKAAEMIQQFSQERHADLWRGLGIACSFVGGFEENALKTLISLSGKHSAQLGVAAALVAESCVEADCLTPDIELANSIFNNLNAEKAMKITLKNKTVTDFSFGDFILQMEKDLENSRQ